MSEKGLQAFDFLKLTEHGGKVEGIFVPDLKEGDIVEVKTQNSLYVFKIIDPAKCTAIVESNGQYITKPTKATIEGSLVGLWSTSIKSKYIAIGHQLELTLELPLSQLYLSLTTAISVNGVRLFPIKNTTVH